jgi:CYTH domain-containing protein
MHVEIERKYRLTPAQGQRALEHAGDPAGEALDQGYLSTEPAVRVRRVVPDTGAAPYAKLTIKGKGTRSRAEFEYDIPADDAAELLKMCGARLTKTRFKIAHAGRTWEVDRFDGSHAGLWLAEIELESEHDAFDPPPWLGDEVTDDPRYANSALAKLGAVP